MRGAFLVSIAHTGLFSTFLLYCTTWYNVVYHRVQIVHSSREEERGKHDDIPSGSA